MGLCEMSPSGTAFTLGYKYNIENIAGVVLEASEVFTEDIAAYEPGTWEEHIIKC
jgi:hypothetical protein